MIRKVSHDVFLYELALHEASHFVSRLSLVKMDDRFCYPSRISVCIESMDNIVMYNKAHDNIGGVIVRNDDVSRMTMINILAGYCSYGIHAADTDEFISKPLNVKDKPYSIEYLTFEEVSNYGYPFLGESFEDFAIVQRLLREHQEHNDESWKDACGELIQATFEYLKNEKVRKAVLFTADYIVQNECKEIVDDDLLRLIKDVKSILKD